MRWSPVAVAFLLLPWAASAQADQPLASDAAGDVAGRGAAADMPPLGMEEALDLRALHVEEQPMGFVMRLTLEDLPPSRTETELSFFYYVEFRHGSKQFQVEVYRGAMGDETRYYGYLYAFDNGTGSYGLIEDLEPTVDGSVIQVFVPRALLRDGMGAAPTAGRVLEDFVATSVGNQIGRVCVNQCIDPMDWGDRMPDTGFAAAVHEVVHGVQQTGSARLSSHEPFRASNGEATTFVFEVQAANVGNEDDLFRFNATGVPDQWDVQPPAQSIRLPAGSNMTFPVIVRTPFAHAHGSAKSFILELQGVRDPSSVGRLEMGVFYPSPPQPAGHHDELWLHTIDHSNDPTSVVLAAGLGLIGAQGTLQDEYMNTLETDDRADEAPSEGEFCHVHTLDADYPVGSGYCWWFLLDPGLLMGLDFDIDRTGSLEVTVGGPLPLPSASIEGQLVHLGPVERDYPPGFPIEFMDREIVPLATINRSTTQDIGAMADASFKVDVIPLPEADRVPYQPGAALALQLQVNTLRPDNFYVGQRAPPPTIEAGGRLQLPLNEYEDEVKGLVAFGSAVVLDGVTDLQRHVNPGKTIVFKAMLRNEASDTDTFRIGLIGSNREWARILGSDTIRLSPGATQQIAVAVSPPAGAAAGDRADLVLEAASQADIDQRALLRFLAIVSTAEDIPDESDLADALSSRAPKKSPGVSIWLLIGALAALGRRRT